MSQQAVDGSIRIDTSISTDGFSEGTKKMSGSLQKIINSVKGFFGAMAKGISGAAGAIKLLGQAISGAFEALLSVDAALLVLAVIGQVVGTIVNAIKTAFTLSKGETARAVQDIKDRFEELKVTFANLFLPLIVAVTPLLMTIIKWLTDVLNRVAMIEAAFLGQKEVLQVVAGSAGKIAKNMKDSAKEARGALAAFDQLNVLEKPDTPTADVATVETKMVPITDDILSTVSRIKQWLADMWSNVYQSASDTWQRIVEKWNLFSDWWKEHISGPIQERAAEAWKNISTWASDTWQRIVEKWTGAGDWFRELWKNVSTWAAETWQKITEKWSNGVTWFNDTIIDPLARFFANVWNFIGILAHDAWATLSFIWGLTVDWFRSHVIDPLIERFSFAWERIKESAANALGELRAKWADLAAWFRAHLTEPISELFAEAWTKISAVWDTVVTWFKTHVTDPLHGAFSTSLNSVGDTWRGVFTGIYAFVKGIINNIIDLINGMLDGFTSGINLVIFSLNSAGAVVPNWINIPAVVPAPKIPHLATGAVIPPNAKFAAILGDQKSGKNIEAPEALIRQIIREESGQQGSREIVIRFEGSMSELVRLLKPHIDKENARIGASFIIGTAKG